MPPWIIGYFILKSCVILFIEICFCNCSNLQKRDAIHINFCLEIVKCPVVTWLFPQIPSIGAVDGWRLLEVMLVWPLVSWQLLKVTLVCFVVSRQLLLTIYLGLSSVDNDCQFFIKSLFFDFFYTWSAKKVTLLLKIFWFKDQNSRLTC